MADRNIGGTGRRRQREAGEFCVDRADECREERKNKVPSSLMPSLGKWIAVEAGNGSAGVCGGPCILFL